MKNAILSITLYAILMAGMADSAQSQTNIIVKPEIPTYVNSKTLKANFESAPFGFNFPKAPKLVEKAEVINGYVPTEKRDTTTQPCEVEIQYDPIDGEIYQTTITVYSSSVNVVTQQLEKLYKFAGYFDPKAEKFFRKKFVKLFYDEPAYRKGIAYKSRSMKLNISLKHDLFSIKEAIATEGPKTMEGRSVIISLTVNNEKKYLAH